MRRERPRAGRADPASTASSRPAATRSNAQRPASDGVDAGRRGPVARAVGSRRTQSADSMNRTRSPFGLAPATDCTGWPPLKMVSVGTDMTR